MLTRAVASVVVTSMLVLTGACTSDPESDANPGKHKKPTASASAEPDRDAVAPGTKKAAQKELDAAFDQLIDDRSGQFASYVNFEGAAIKTEGRFDLVDLEMEALTRFSTRPGSDESTAIKSRVIGTEIFGGPNFGPYSKCWFHYATGSIDKLLPGDLPFQEDFAAIPIGLVIAADARAIGSVENNTFDIRARVSGQAALVAFSSPFATSVFDKLPKKDVTVEATITIRNGTYTNVTIHGYDIVEAYDGRKIDLFDEAPSGFKRVFKSAILTSAFRKYATPVSVKRPPADSLVEVAGPDEVEGNPLCAAVQS